MDSSKAKLSLNLSVGIPELDGQHAEFLRRTEALTLALRGAETPPAEKMEEMLSFLESYADGHFASEERYLTRSKYPLLDHHLREHGAFRQVLTEFREELRQQNSRSRSDSVQRLRTIANLMLGWLVSHIYVSDKGYAEYISD